MFERSYKIIISQINLFVEEDATENAQPHLNPRAMVCEWRKVGFCGVKVRLTLMSINRNFYDFQAVSCHGSDHESTMRQHEIYGLIGIIYLNLIHRNSRGAL